MEDTKMTVQEEFLYLKEIIEDIKIKDAWEINAECEFTTGGNECENCFHKDTCESIRGRLREIAEKKIVDWSVGDAEIMKELFAQTEVNRSFNGDDFSKRDFFILKNEMIRRKNRRLEEFKTICETAKGDCQHCSGICGVWSWNDCYNLKSVLRKTAKKVPAEWSFNEIEVFGEILVQEFLEHYSS